MAEFVNPQPTSLPSQLLQFLDLSDTSLTQTERVNLANIVQPSTLPLPGTGGVVWKTPRNISPDFEFGDGVSAVFKSLSVSSPSPNRTPAPASTRSGPMLSASSSPFVPNMSSHSIPIPLPAMGSGQGSAHPQTIHINNFTANLNYHGMPNNHHNAHDNQESPVNSYQTQSGNQPIPFAHGPYPQQYVAPFRSGQPQIHPQQAPNIYSDPAQFHPGMVYVSMPGHQAYHGPHIVQQRPREDPHLAVANGGITFGSTPVVSIRSGKRISETEDMCVEEKASTPVIAETKFKGLTSVSSEESPVHPKHNFTEAIDEPVPISKADSPKIKKNFPSPHSSVESDSYPSTKPASEPVRHIKPVGISQLPQTAQSLTKSPKTLSDPVRNGIEPQKKKEPEPNKSSTDSPPVGSWASLFASKTAISNVDSSTKPMARIPPFSATDSSESPLSNDVNSGEKDLGILLNTYALKHVSTALLPRGLTNRSNWCFVNAILQALLACPPFYNLVKSLSSIVVGLKSQKSKTPMLDSIVEFVNEFSVLEQMNKTQKKDKNRKKDDIVTGIGLEPSYVYKMLLNLEEDTFKVVDGRQEDAEEFLTCLLNGLSDEMLGMMKLASEQPVAEALAIEPTVDDAPDDWQEVGAKGKSCVTRRVTSSTQIQTPIQSLALGMCRSCVKSETGDNSATLQPFYTLQLDIQDQLIQSVTDALEQNFANEKLDGFICSKTKKEIDATRILSLEELPPILILHLKRFVYDGQTGGVQKIMKQIEFGVDLEISRNILSAECRANTSTRQRQYKLFGVVYHNGREATKGHYVTDVFHTGYGTWLHCDDSIVQPTSEQLVMAPNASSTPYLLFYRRGDTMVGMEKRA